MTIYVSNLSGDFLTTGDAFASARALRGAAPHAWPNRRIVALADTVLDCCGQLVALPVGA